METVSKLLDALKFSPRYWFSLAVILAFLLFLPLAWLDMIGVGGLAAQYRAYVGVGLLACCMVLLASGLGWLAPMIDTWNTERRGKKRLHRLTADEKQRLRCYIEHGTRSSNFFLEDGPVLGLVKEGVLYQASEHGTSTGCPFNIHDWAWEYLNKHPELLAPSKPSSNRP